MKAILIALGLLVAVPAHAATMTFTGTTTGAGYGWGGTGGVSLEFCNLPPCGSPIVAESWQYQTEEEYQSEITGLPARFDITFDPAGAIETIEPQWHQVSWTGSVNLNVTIGSFSRLFAGAATLSILYEPGPFGVMESIGRMDAFVTGTTDDSMNFAFGAAAFDWVPFGQPAFAVDFGVASYSADIAPDYSFGFNLWNDVRSVSATGGIATARYVPTPVPLPASGLLMLAGLVAIGARRFRRELSGVER